jgi:signal transduction histidine kinase
MIGKLRRKFVAFAMLSIMLVTLFIFGVITIDMKIRQDTNLDMVLNYIAENGGIMPEYDVGRKNSFITPETRYSTRYFVVRLNDNNVVFDKNLENIASIDENAAIDMATKVAESGSARGYYGSFRYVVNQSSQHKTIIFLDAHTQINNFNVYMNKAIIIITLGLLVTLIVASILSKKATGPVIESIEKQKQFITNAGHDLKTPVAVILADTEVLEFQLGEDDEWVKSIKNQAKRLDTLIKSLLNLAKVDENNKKKPELTEFDVGQVVQEEIDSIKVLAKNKEIVYNKPDKEFKIIRDKIGISQVVTILLDNAIKYAPEGTNISVAVSKFGKNNVKIQISNKYEGKKIDPNKLFDRFYRADKSRNTRREGYGIGLSMAKSIVEANKGRINCNIDSNDNINFIVIL